MFLSEERLMKVWDDKNRKTIDEDISPLFKGSGDISEEPHIENIDERIGFACRRFGTIKTRR